MPWGEIMAKNMNKYKNKTQKNDINQYIYEYRNKYTDNKKVLDGLYIMLDETKKGIQTKYTEDIILGAIERKKQEQEQIVKYLRKNINTKYRKKTLAKYKDNTPKKEKQPTTTEIVKTSKIGVYIKNPIINDKEIIIETNIVNKYVSDIVETKIEPKAKSRNVATVLDSLRARRNKIKEFTGAKVVFDGVYKIIYEGQTIFSEPIDDVLLDYNYSESNAKNNINIIRMLERFDEKNNSNLCNKYRNGELKVYYDLLQYARVQDDKSITKQITKIAKKEAKNNNNVTVYRENKFNKFKIGVSAIAAAALVALGSFSLANKLGKNKTVANSRNASIEYMADNDVEELSTVSNTSEAITEATTQMTTESTTEITTEAIAEAITEAAETKVEPVIEVKEEVESQPIIEENNEFDLKIGDTLSLGDVDLYYTSTDEVAVGNASYLDGYTLQVSLFSVVYKGECIAVISDSSKTSAELEKEYKEKYGDDIEIKVNGAAINPEGNVYANYLGWIDESVTIGQGILIVVIQLAVAFFIWFLFMRYYRAEAKKMNDRIQAMK